MSGKEQSVAPQVIRCDGIQRESVRANPALSKLAYFGNFGGGHLVGTSIAFHPQGQECGTHTHRGAVEMFVVLDGTGVIEMDSMPYSVSQDDCVVVPPGTPHNLRGTSNIPFKVLCVFVVAPGCEDDTAPWLPLVAQ